LLNSAPTTAAVANVLTNKLNKYGPSSLFYLEHSNSTTPSNKLYNQLTHHQRHSYRQVPHGLYSSGCTTNPFDSSSAIAYIPTTTTNSDSNQATATAALFFPSTGEQSIGIQTGYLATTPAFSDLTFATPLTTANLNNKAAAALVDQFTGSLTKSTAYLGANNMNRGGSLLFGQIMKKRKRRCKKPLELRKVLPKNSLMLLHEYRPNVEYRFVCQSGPIHRPIFTMAVDINEHKFEGTGKTKKEARIVAAEKAIEFLLKHPEYIQKSKAQTGSTKSTLSNKIDSLDEEATNENNNESKLESDEDSDDDFDDDDDSNLNENHDENESAQLAQSTTIVSSKNDSSFSAVNHEDMKRIKTTHKKEENTNMSNNIAESSISTNNDKMNSDQI
jgi:hypothetical protein